MTARKPALIALTLALLGLGPLSAWAGEASAADLQRLYDPFVARAARDHGVDPSFIHAVIRAESNYDPFALSEKGAMGLMQLMPETALQYGVRNVFDPAQNIDGGTKYLKDLMKLFNNKTDLVLAAYNAGQEAVRKYGQRIPPYRETRDYIDRIMAGYKKDKIPSERARTRTPIFTVIDASGRKIATNDPASVRRNKD